jgi:hypothetical protein
MRSHSYQRVCFEFASRVTYRMCDDPFFLNLEPAGPLPAAHYIALFRHVQWRFCLSARLDGIWHKSRLIPVFIVAVLIGKGMVLNASTLGLTQ